MVASPVIGLMLVLLALPASAQGGYFANWHDRVAKAQSEQPNWASPLVTTTPRLTQRVRYDQFWLTNNQGITTNIFDGGKGISLIPFSRVAVYFNLPPYLEHNDPAVRDGFGDVSFQLKYRLLSANAKNGDYILTLILKASVPTGSHSNGAPVALVAPAIGYGKGMGAFVVQGYLGAVLPTGDTGTLGRAVVWNNAFQYRIFRKLWPEAELNTVFYQDGPHDGQVQNFVTPGMMIGTIPLVGHTGLTFGGGFQIATSRYHTTNRNGIFSIRLSF